MPKDWVALIQVRLEEVPMVVLPWPNRTLLAAKVTKAMFGVAPPEEVREPLAVTEVTPPTVGVLVAMSLPLPSKAT